MFIPTGISKDIFNWALTCYGPSMPTRDRKDNGLLESQNGSGRVASEAQIPFLNELLRWSLDTTHWPVPAKQSANAPWRRRKRSNLRAYQSLARRIERLLRQFPQDERLRRIAAEMAEAIKDPKAASQLVSYSSKGGYSWFIPRGVKPAIGPRLLLAVCIAKELYPARSPYQVVLEESGKIEGKNADAVNCQKRAIEKQIFRVLQHPEKYPVPGGPPTTDPCVLLGHELVDFKIWKEEQAHPDMSIEEFDRQFNDYLIRIHPTAEEEELLARLVEQFLRGSHRRLKKV